MKEFLDIYRYLATVGDIDKDVFISFLSKIEGTIPVKMLVDHFKKELENEDSSAMKRIIDTLVVLESELTVAVEDVTTDTDATVHPAQMEETGETVGIADKIRDTYDEAFGETIATDGSFNLRKKLSESIKQMPSGFRTKDVAELIFDKYEKAGIKIREKSPGVYARKYILYLVKQGLLQGISKDGHTIYSFITDKKITEVKDKTLFVKFQEEILAKAEDLDWREVRIEEIESHFPEKTATQIKKALAALLEKYMITQFPPKLKELETAESENKPKPKGYIHFKAK